MRSWLRRFKTHPKECLAHILWGAVAGCFPGVEGQALLVGGWVYQFGSGWRKQQQGRIDTVGMDCFDYPLGYLITATARRLWP